MIERLIRRRFNAVQVAFIFVAGNLLVHDGIRALIALLIGGVISDLLIWAARRKSLRR